jgi:hypothetical protein
MGDSVVPIGEIGNGSGSEVGLRRNELMKYIVYGAGSPIEVEALSPEIAEAEVIRDHGVALESLVVVRKSDVMLHRRRSS